MRQNRTPYPAKLLEAKSSPGSKILFTGAASGNHAQLLDNKAFMPIDSSVYDIFFMQFLKLKFMPTA